MREERLLEQVRASRVLRQAYRLAREAGVALYLVGGALRDLLMGRPWEEDLDLLVSGHPEVLARPLARRLGGAMVVLDPQRGYLRVAYRGGRVDLVPLEGPLEDDLARRDFTLNALALDLRGAFEGRACLQDPMGGMRDLRGGTLRAVHDRSMAEDPLRCLRALRLAATHGFEIEPRTQRLIRAHAPELSRCAPERIREELFRLLEVPHSAPVLRGAAELGVLQAILPGPADLELLERLEEVLEEWGVPPALREPLEERVNGAGLLKLVALLHEREGISALLRERLRLGRRAQHDARAVQEGYRELRRRWPLRLSPRERYRLCRSLQRPWGAFWLLAAWLWGRSGELGPLRELVDYYRERYLRLAARPLLSGRQVMELLGLRPGPQVGEVLERLREEQALGLISNEGEARRAILRWFQRGERDHGPGEGQKATAEDAGGAAEADRRQASGAHR